MNKIFLSALSLSMAFALYGCSSDSATVTKTKEVKQVVGKLEKDVYIKLKDKNINNDNVFKLGKKNNIYTASIDLTKGSHSFQIVDKDSTCGTKFGPKVDESARFGANLDLDNCANGYYTINVLLPGSYNFTFDYTKEVPSVKVLKGTKKVVLKREPPRTIECDKWDGGAVTVNVSKAWRNGTKVRDAYTGQEAVVKSGKVTMTPAANSEGILMLEEVKNVEKPAFSWDNANVYFMLTDRFNNGDKSNDHSYGRKFDGKDEVGTWHGGDFKGVTEKLDYIKSLGMNAIWVTPIVEQVHGFIGGGAQGSFPFYGYHGYWALDFTKIDKNLGSEEDFQRFIEEAHKRGIRVLIDVVMNHAGYATLKDLQDLGLEELALNTDKLPDDWSDFKPRGLYGTWGSVNGSINYKTKSWNKWWGPSWVRAGLPGHDEPGVEEENLLVGGLPDFKTESKNFVKLPQFFKNKKDTNAKDLPNATIVDYLVSWHTYYVRNFGVDGFRADTVKHVDPDAWEKLSKEAHKALKEWKANNPTKKLDDLPFFMVGEYYDHGVSRDLWYDKGFDSLINFDYQKYSTTYAQCMSAAEQTFDKYSQVVQEKGFNFLSYISSHDTKLFFADYEDFDFQKRAANSFLMLPGQIQVYYGDESGRRLMKDGGVLDQSVRSDMNWADLDKPENKDLIEHWSKLSNFRLNHPAIAAGIHKKISNKPYAFMRTHGNDKVVIVAAGRK